MKNLGNKVVEIWNRTKDFHDKFWGTGFWNSALVVLSILFLFILVLTYIVVSVIIEFFTSKLFRVLLAISYFYEQNQFYGWNPKPKSEMELLTDGIWVLCLIVALYTPAKKEEA